MKIYAKCDGPEAIIEAQGMWLAKIQREATERKKTKTKYGGKAEHIDFLLFIFGVKEESNGPQRQFLQSILTLRYGSLPE